MRAERLHVLKRNQVVEELQSPPACSGFQSSQEHGAPATPPRTISGSRAGRPDNFAHIPAHRLCCTATANGGRGPLRVIRDRLNKARPTHLDRCATDSGHPVRPARSDTIRQSSRVVAGRQLDRRRGERPTIRRKGQRRAGRPAQVGRGRAGARQWRRAVVAGDGDPRHGSNALAIRQARRCASTSAMRPIATEISASQRTAAIG